MRTRIVKLTESEYVPQVWVPHFLCGGHWSGIQRDTDGGLWTYDGDTGQLERCVVTSEKEANDILSAYVTRTQKKVMLK
jgi:hypothetical protein